MRPYKSAFCSSGEIEVLEVIIYLLINGIWNETFKYSSNWLMVSVCFSRAINSICVDELKGKHSQQFSHIMHDLSIYCEMDENISILVDRSDKEDGWGGYWRTLLMIHNWWGGKLNQKEWPLREFLLSDQFYPRSSEIYVAFYWSNTTWINLSVAVKSSCFRGIRLHLLIQHQAIKCLYILYQLYFPVVPLLTFSPYIFRDAELTPISACQSWASPLTFVHIKWKWADILTMNISVN